VIVCSPTLPIGPGDRGQTPPTRLAVAFCQGRIPAYLDCRFNLIDVRDALTGRALGEWTVPGLDESVAWEVCQGAALVAEEERASLYELPA
jgi:hypothetical protein